MTAPLIIIATSLALAAYATRKVLEWADHIGACLEADNRD